MVHLARLLDVEDARNDLSFSRRELCRGFFERPRPVIAVVAEREIRILRRRECRVVRVDHHFEHPIDDAGRHLFVQRRAEGLIG